MKTQINFRAMFLMVLLAVVLSIPLLSHAGGVVVVGKGGGFAEMQAYQFDQNLKPLVDLCLKLENPCELTTQELLWTQNLKLDLLNANRPLLQINETCAAPTLHADSNGRYSIDACALYRTNVSDNFETAKSAQEILQLVLIAGIRSANQGSGDSAALKIARGFSQSQLQSFALPPSGGGVFLHLWSAKWALQNLTFLSVESPLRTIDLSSALLAELGCAGHAVNWTMQPPRFQEISSQKTQGQAPVEWTCGTQKWKGELHLQFVFAQGHLNSFELVILRRIRL